MKSVVFHKINIEIRRFTTKVIYFNFSERKIKKSKNRDTIATAHMQYSGKKKKKKKGKKKKKKNKKKKKEKKEKL